MIKRRIKIKAENLSVRVQSLLSSFQDFEYIHFLENSNLEALPGDGLVFGYYCNDIWYESALRAFYPLNGGWSDFREAGGLGSPAACLLAPHCLNLVQLLRGRARNG